MAEPITIASQGHFFTGLGEHDGPSGVSVSGTHVEWQEPLSVRANLILVHGGGGQALDMLGTPDGREGWSTLFLRDGFAVYTVDRPGLGRSPYNLEVFGAPGAPAVYGSFAASFAGPAADGLPPHTQWPGSGERDDPALAQFLAGQESLNGPVPRIQEEMRAGAAGLLDRIGPSVVLTHSMGASFGWLAASERRHLVRAIVAVEPAGPPQVPVSFGPERSDAKLGGLPVAVVSAESSGFGPACATTAGYLRDCGAEVTELKLADLGIHGNGHAMMLEKNNAEIASVITDWISKAL